VSVIGHGSSSPNAFKNAIRMANTAVTGGLSSHIAAHFARREAQG
jgi:hypothetical protein